MSLLQPSLEKPSQARLRKLSEATALQRRAADPEASVWVNASAGTGKTKVLTDRVLTLMLHGTPPERLLCLTFTKAAAAEMRNRLAKVLQAWATCSEQELEDRLFDLLGRRPDHAEFLRARQLLARVIDSPGGMKIQTIHSFCQSLLARFPLEAGIAPNFHLIEEQGAAERLAAARDAVLAESWQAGKEKLAEAVERISPLAAEQDFMGLLRALIGERGRLQKLLHHYGSADGIAEAVAERLRVSPAETPEQIIAAACRDAAFDGDGLRQVIAALKAGKKSDCERAALLEAFLSLAEEERPAAWERYLSAFFTSKRERRKSFATKDVISAYAELPEIMQTECERLERVCERLKAVTLFCSTQALLRLTCAILERYERDKAERGLLDYDDLILLSRNLLQQAEVVPWVLYKLDGGIDHLLIDEAQDTNPEQWEIVRRITEEFFAGEGAAEARGLGPPRSIFAVGDGKQSIYRFQRADPQQFADMQGYFAGRVRDGERRWDPVDLIHSFRSSAAVLRLVDAVFENEEARRGLHFRTDWLKHDPVRVGQGGRVEVWPAPAPAPQEEEDPWEAAAPQNQQPAPRTRLARLIASRIARWTRAREVGEGHEAWLEARGRQLQPGDFLVLVRRRNAFVEELVRELKQRDIPVAGADRMVLTEQLAVMDLMALGRVLLLPEDDLTLATVLKGPLVGLSEEQLFELAWKRPGNLWSALRARASEEGPYRKAFQFISHLMASADYRPPFELYAELLARGGRSRLLRRLGPDAADPIEEFLNLARTYEREAPPSLEGFLHWLESQPREIKRDMEAGTGEVRIMTIHGAKGLQAPVVILPDTLQKPRNDTRLLWLAEEGEPAPLPLWAPRRDMEEQVAAAARAQEVAAMEEEYNRLLYVALTRAEDRLYICGWHGSQKAPEGNWYDLVTQACATGLAEAIDFDFTAELPQGEGWAGPGWRLIEPQSAELEETAFPQRRSQLEPLPAWTRQKPPTEAQPPRPLAPSQPSEREPAPHSPLGEARQAAIQRGILIHRLLQSLPDLPPERRAEAARRWLRQPLHALTEEAAEALLAEVLAVLQSEDFAAIFGPGSRAEVPIAGLIEGPAGPVPLSGQIDRLLVGPEEILVVDYKTNRPAPQDSKDVAPAYLRQMAAYRALLQQIYPGRPVRCALLWTDIPRLMPLEAALLDRAFPS